MKGDKTIAMLEERLQAREPLSAEEMADALCQLGAVVCAPTRRTLAHRMYSELPPCPIFIDTRIQPKGPLSSKQVNLLGQHMALAFEPYAQDRRIILAGVPQSGRHLAEAFSEQWSGDDRESECLKIIRRSKVELALAKQRKPRLETDYSLIIDNATETGNTAGKAALVLQRDGYNVDCFVLVNRDEGARELLEAINVRLIAFVSLMTVVKKAIELHSQEIWGRLQAFQNALRNRIGLPRVQLP